MFFTVKIKKNTADKTAIHKYVVEAMSFTEAEHIANELFKDDTGFLGVDDVVKYNIKKAFVDDAHDSFFQCKLEFAFIDAKAFKEAYLVQERTFTDALNFIKSQISEGEIGYTTVVEQKAIDIQEVYTREKLLEMGVYSPEMLTEEGQKLIEELDNL